MSMKAVVKSVISGDTLVLRGPTGPQGQPPKERILHLSDITAPRMGNTTREDEPWAFESRDFLRSLAVGKPISFTSTHSLPSNDDITRDIGTAEIGGLDVTSELLKNGWAKVKDLKRDPTEDDIRKRDLEAEAKVAGSGFWNPHGPQAHTGASYDAAGLSALVEQVRDGSTLRVRLYMPDGEHQLINVALAGVRCARTSSKPDEPSEPWAEEAKFFTESRLLQRTVRVMILSLPNAPATPFQTAATTQPPASIFIGSVLHPAGNVAEHLVAAGLARVVDWHAGMLASSGGMERLRAAEKVAKEKRVCLYASALVPSAPASTKANGAPNGNSRLFEGVVIRVWSGEQISVAEKENGKERRLYLSSTRTPKLSDPKQAFYAQEAREFLRKRLIGKNVRVAVDFIRPREGEFEERECATVRYGGQNSNIAEQLIEKGLASIVRHRRDDEDRSPDYDKLMAAEQAASTETRGIHSGKEQPPPKQPLNLSETAARANSFLSGFKRQGKIFAVVDYVASGSRFKLFIPKDNQTLTLVLSGIRTPRTARNPSEKSEPFGSEAAEFAARRYMQRDVEFEVESTDKSGGFIGALWLKNENAAISLVREGYAFVHAFSADGLSWAKQIYDAEAEAKQARRNVWQDYDEEAEKAAQAPVEDASAPLKPEYIDVIVSDIRTKNGLNFSVQVLNTEGIASLEKLMRDFSLHHKSAAVPANFTPTNGDLVSAKFSDGSWYRAKFGERHLSRRRLRLPSSTTAQDARLRFTLISSSSISGIDQSHSFVKLVNSDSEYHLEAVDRFRSLCEGRRLIANIDQKEGNILHLRLIDPADPAAAQNPLACINADLLREGLASIDRKNCRATPAPLLLSTHKISFNGFDLVPKQVCSLKSNDRQAAPGVDFRFGELPKSPFRPWISPPLSEKDPNDLHILEGGLQAEQRPRVGRLGALKQFFTDPTAFLSDDLRRIRSGHVRRLRTLLTLYCCFCVLFLTVKIRAYFCATLEVAQPSHHSSWKPEPFSIAKAGIHDMADSELPRLNVTSSQRLSVAFRELAPQAHLDTYIVQAQARVNAAYQLDDLTACLWIEDVRVEEVFVSATTWPGEVSLVVVTTREPNSTAYTSLLGYLVTTYASTHVCVHVLYVPSIAGGSSNAYLNMARFFARTSRVVLFPDDIPKSFSGLGSNRARWLDKLPVNTPHPVLLGNTTHNLRVFSPRPLAPVALLRDHPVWCTERFYMFGSRALDWEDCLWRLWLEGAGDASSIAVPHLWEEISNSNTTVPSVPSYAMKIRLRWSTKYRSEACAFALKRSQAIDPLSKTEKRRAQWKKRFCRETVGLGALDIP
ncbi:hypothetical protein JVU11DRAFT_2772 [Chiua virens]|nr:hypothetical protein JVU11DRAFT_2772 [Chiua virens]